MIYFLIRYKIDRIEAKIDIELKIEEASSLASLFPLEGRQPLLRLLRREVIGATHQVGALGG